MFDDGIGTAIGVAAGFVPPSDWEPIPDEIFEELGPPPWLDEAPEDDADRFVDRALERPVSGETLTLIEATPVAALSASARTHALQQLERLTAHLEAVKLELIAAIAGPDPTVLTDANRRSDDYAAHEVAVATTCSVYAADVKVHVARELASRREATADAMGRGQVSYPQARALCEATYGLDDELADQIETAVLRFAHRQSLAAFKASVARWSARLDPDWTAKASAARRECIVDHSAGPDGCGELFVRGPLEITTPISMTLTRYAAKHRDQLGGTVAQRKLVGLRELAERFLDAPEAGTVHGRPPTVNLCLDTPTLLGLADHPAEIPGVGQIPADVARWLLADGAPLRRMLIDPETGRCLDYGQATYQVPPELAEQLIAVHVHSAAPHSQVPAAGCDIDHNMPYDTGGATSTLNLTPLDRRWHRAKTHADWAYDKNPDTDVITWTSPSGLTAQVHPYDYRCGP